VQIRFDSTRLKGFSFELLSLWKKQFEDLSLNELESDPMMPPPWSARGAARGDYFKSILLELPTSAALPLAK
jgi:hypothetical protein